MPDHDSEAWANGCADPDSGVQTSWECDIRPYCQKVSEKVCNVSASYGSSKSCARMQYETTSEQQLAVECTSSERMSMRRVTQAR